MIVTALLTVSALAQTIALPEPDIAVGYTRSSVDTGQADNLTPAAEDTRVLGVEIWYPASQDGPAKAWASEAMGRSLSEQFPFPAGFESEVAAHASAEAAPLAGAHPVILLSPGLSFPVTLYQSFAERLASEGYVVIAVSHPHGTSLIEYEDGSMLDMTLWPSFETEAERQGFLAEHAGVWERDLERVLDVLPSWNADENHPLSGHLDLEHIGAAGHSYGGTAVGRLSRDPRVDAVVAMEGAVRDPEDEEGRGTLRAGAPLLHIIGGYNRFEMEIPDYTPAPDAPVYRAVINGTGHAQLSDLIYVYSGFADEAWHARSRYGLAPDRVLQITHDYMTAFFDLYLRGEDETPLLHPRGPAARLSGPSTAGYTEVDLTIDIAGHGGGPD